MGEVIPFKSKRQLQIEKEDYEFLSFIKNTFGLQSNNHAENLLRAAILMAGEQIGENK